MNEDECHKNQGRSYNTPRVVRSQSREMAAQADLLLRAHPASSAHTPRSSYVVLCHKQVCKQPQLPMEALGTLLQCGSSSLSSLQTPTAVELPCGARGLYPPPSRCVLGRSSHGKGCISELNNAMQNISPSNHAELAAQPNART